MEQTKLKIAVAFHKETQVDNYINNKNIYIPIFGGKELYKGNSQFLLNMQGDNTGDNISTLNPNLNEGTVLYWFAKHLKQFGDPDYIGFEHYRRFLIFNQNDLNQNTIIASKYNLIFFSVAQHLCQKEISFESMNIYVNFIINFFPQEYELIREYFNSKEYYVANMFIMPKQIFEKYKKFLFTLIDLSKLLLKYKPQLIKQTPRAFAMMLQRMTGYFIFKQEKNGIKIKDNGILVPQNEQERFKEFYNYGNYYYLNDNNEYIKVH